MFRQLRSCSLLGFSAALLLFSLGATSPGPGKTKTENFDRDPGWQGVNNRSAQTTPPATVRQDFGYSPTNKSGGAKAGEIGGFISQAGEVAYYAKEIEPKTLNDPLSASGTFWCADGGYHLLLGFFNAGTTNEWRTPNTISMRLQGRGNNIFYAYVEYCTSKWRAGGDTTPFPSREDPVTHRKSLIGFASGTLHKWSLKYDPAANGGKGAVTATIDGETAICNLDESHKADGATFNRFGIMNVIKSADGGSEVYLDDITVNGKSDSFDTDPKWEGKNNRKTWKSTIVRPRFDFGFSDTQFAGGKAKGELGGLIFRGDCRYPERMACYGDAVGPLKLDKPFKASGKIAMTRGVTDASVLFGFYNSKDSMRSNDSQDDGAPECVVGVQAEGPSSEGFFFYPLYRTKGAHSKVASSRSFPHIHPDGAKHDWTLEYNPDGAGGKGQITVSLDGKSGTLDLDEGVKSSGIEFDRFGIVTPWIDGNSENVYWDNVTYTMAQ